MATIRDVRGLVPFHRCSFPAIAASDRLRLISRNSKVPFTIVADGTWLTSLDKGDAPCAPVLPRGAVPDHPQVIASGTVETFEHPGVGVVRRARPAARFEESPAAIQGPAPYLGQHSAEVLSDLGYDGAVIAEFATSDVVKCHQ